MISPHHFHPTNGVGPSDSNVSADKGRVFKVANCDLKHGAGKAYEIYALRLYREWRCNA